jgi:hypothetical protein
MSETGWARKALCGINGLRKLQNSATERADDERVGIKRCADFVFKPNQITVDSYQVLVRESGA